MKIRYVQLHIGRVIVMVAAPEDENVSDERLVDAGLSATRHVGGIFGKSPKEPIGVLSIGDAELNA